MGMQMNLPVVSIIVPIYNVEKYMNKCVESIVNQSYRNLEILLIDDGSPDRCPQLCDAWAQRDSRIQVIHKANGGLSSARNAGLEVANGDYVLFVDSDDWLDTDAVEALLAGIEAQHADICACGFYIEHLDAEGQTAETTAFIYHKPDIVLNYVLDKIRPEVCNKLYRRAVIGTLRFDETVRYAEDILFNYTAFKNAQCVCSIGAPKYHYLQNSGNSITTDFITDARAQSWQTCEKMVLDCVGQPALYQAAVYRFIVYSFGILSRVLLVEDFCKKYYDALADKIISYRMDIWKNQYLSRKHKLSAALLSVSKPLFKRIFLFLHRNGGVLHRAKLFAAKIAFGLQTGAYALKANLQRCMHRNNFIFFVLTPCHENYGDQALAYAGSRFLEDYFVFEITGDLLSRFVHYPKLFRKMIGRSTIVFNGGGYLGTLWLAYGEEILRSVLQLVPNNKMLVLPQSIYYADDACGAAELEKSKQIYAACPRLILTARDKTSYALMKAYYPKTQVYLMPDMVLSLNQCKKDCKRSGAMLVLRDDIEKKTSDALADAVSALLMEQYGAVRKIDMMAAHRISPKDREKELEIHFRRFRESEMVVTDRLHGMIFSAITGTPCVVFNSKTHKVRGVYEWMFSDCPYIICTEDMDEIRAFIASVRGREFTYSNAQAEAMFGELKKLLS